MRGTIRRVILADTDILDLLGSCNIIIIRHNIRGLIDYRCLLPGYDDIIKTTRPHLCFFLHHLSTLPVTVESSAIIPLHNTFKNVSTQENGQVTEDAHVVHSRLGKGK